MSKLEVNSSEEWKVDGSLGIMILDYVDKHLKDWFFKDSIFWIAENFFDVRKDTAEKVANLRTEVEKNDFRRQMYGLETVPRDEYVTKPSKEEKLKSDEKWIKWFLSIIRRYESSNNYDAVSWIENQTVIQFTKMSIKEVLDYQQWLIDSGKDSPIWAYQVKKSTLEMICEKHGISLDEKFSPEMQDRIWLLLLKHRWLDNYINWKISIDKFQENLSKEWAFFPKDKSWESYYAWVWNNKALIPHSKMRKHLESLVA